MSFTEKIDVLDLLISILREHEEKLDAVSEKLETAAEVMEQVTRNTLGANKLNRVEELALRCKAELENEEVDGRDRARVSKFIEVLDGILEEVVKDLGAHDPGVLK